MANNKNTENNVTFSDNKKYHVMIPFELLEFLSDDYSYKNKSRFSRLSKSCGELLYVLEKTRGHGGKY